MGCGVGFVDFVEMAEIVVVVVDQALPSLGYYLLHSLITQLACL